MVISSEWFHVHIQARNDSFPEVFVLRARKQLFDSMMLKPYVEVMDAKGSMMVKPHVEAMNKHDGWQPQLSSQATAHQWVTWGSWPSWAFTWLQVPASKFLQPPLRPQVITAQLGTVNLQNCEIIIHWCFLPLSSEVIHDLITDRWNKCLPKHISLGCIWL